MQILLVTNLTHADLSGTIGTDVLKCKNGGGGSVKIAGFCQKGGSGYEKKHIDSAGFDDVSLYCSQPGVCCRSFGFD